MTIDTSPLNPPEDYTHDTHDVWLERLRETQALKGYDAEIISSHDFPNFNFGFQGAHLESIPIDFSWSSRLYVISIGPNISVPRHAHDAPIFKYVIQGRFTLNGTRFGAGDWVFIRAGAEYEIVTDKGYTILSPYNSGSKPVDLPTSS